jgi:predicted dehydrogenase
VLGFIGVGNMGRRHLDSFLGFDDVHIAAVCDVRRSFRQAAKEKVNRIYGAGDCAAYVDYRELLSRSDIDAVAIVTPGHWHALIGIEAAGNRKAIYCEKPLDNHVAANKAFRDAVNRSGVTFQFGTQQRSDAKFRQACELARSGRFGRLHTIMVGSLPSISFPSQRTEPVPAKEEFDYDMWLGPAPRAAYQYERCASRTMGSVGVWPHIYDYSLGGIGGAWGIHHVDIAQWGNGTEDTGPVEIRGSGILPEDGLTDTLIEWDIEMVYANGVRLLYMDTNTAMKRRWQFRQHSLQWPGCGILFVGSEGWVLAGRGNIHAEPKSLLKTVLGKGEARLYRSDDHRRNFIDCVRNGGKTICPIEAAVRSDTICHLSDVAARLGRTLRWNPQEEQFVGDAEANRMLIRPLRSPWHL